MSDDLTEIGCKFDFDRDGPKLGSVRFLEKTALGFIVRPATDIEAELAAAFGPGIDGSGLSDGLTQICRSMNEGDLAKAAISLRFLRLSPTGQRPDVVAKASPDDPVAPGWPAGTPGGVGGQFRPKDGAQAGEAATPIVDVDRSEKAQRLARRRSVRSVLKRILSAKRLLRLLGENAAAALTEEIPGIDAALTAAAVADDIALLKEITGDLNDATPAIELAEKGPVDIKSLQVSSDHQGFDSFNAFKKIDLEKQFGPAGDGLDFHHLVEQGPNAGVFPESQLQSTDNIVKIPRLLHEEINSYFAKPRFFGDSFITPREYLRNRSFDEQRTFGIKVLRDLGAVK